MSEVLLLDTNVWSHLVLGDHAKRRKVQADLVGLLDKYPGAGRATSRICIAECLVAARRFADPTQRHLAESAFMAEFESPQLMVVEVSARVADTAASLRADAIRRAHTAGGGTVGDNGGKLRLPDALIAASCLDFDPPAVLVTENTADFCWLQGGKLQTVGGLLLESIG